LGFAGRVSVTLDDPEKPRLAFSVIPSGAENRSVRLFAPSGGFPGEALIAQARRLRGLGLTPVDLSLHDGAFRGRLLGVLE
jgi:hypothetical protein